MGTDRVLQMAEIVEDTVQDRTLYVGYNRFKDAGTVKVDFQMFSMRSDCVEWLLGGIRTTEWQYYYDSEGTRFREPIEAALRNHFNDHNEIMCKDHGEYYGFIEVPRENTAFRFQFVLEEYTDYVQTTTRCKSVGACIGNGYSGNVR